VAGRAAVRNRGEWRPAAALPVARVAVDVPLAHLDRPFDYAVPEHLDDAAGVGARVRVRFAGRLVDGFVLERVAASEHPGRLAWLEKVVSSEQALPPEIAALCRAVADRYGGVLAESCAWPCRRGTPASRPSGPAQRVSPRRPRVPRQPSRCGLPRRRKLTRLTATFPPRRAAGYWTPPTRPRRPARRGWPVPPRRLVPWG